MQSQKDKKSARAAGGKWPDAACKKKILHAHQTGQGVTACKRKLRAPQGGWQHRKNEKASACTAQKNISGRAWSDRTGAKVSAKKYTARHREEVTGQGRVFMQKKEPCARRRGRDRTLLSPAEKPVRGALSGSKKEKKWSARQGSDRTEKCCATKEKGAARQKLQVTADRPSWTGLRGQNGQRPVQPVHQGGSTAFNQDGPGKNWLKTAEPKFSC
jgi:hypothetical protein